MFNDELILDDSWEQSGNINFIEVAREYDSIDEESLDDEIKFNLTSTPNDFNVMTLISFIDKGIFKIPPFQRNYIWNREKASRLIESLLIGLPIPQIFLYEDQRNSLSIIDGQQRLLSIYFFCKGRFPKNDTARAKLRDKDISEKGQFIKNAILEDEELFTSFSLALNTKLNPNRNNRLHGLNYATLDENDQTNLDLATIRNMIIKPETAVNNLHQAMFEIFNRLNSGGMNLNSQEIRMSLYACDFMNSLELLNQNETWRQLIGKNKADIRLRDSEQILRLVAVLVSGTKEHPTHLSNMRNQFKSPLTAFLNRFAEYSKDLNNEDIKLIVDIWNKFFKSIQNLPTFVFSNTVNDIDAKVSLPVLEALFFACCKGMLDGTADNVVQLTEENVKNLKETTEFLEKSTGKTSSRVNVYDRLDIAYKFFKEQ